MTSKFESIFQDANVKPSLNKLFSRKVESVPVESTAAEDTNNNNVETNKATTDETKTKLKKLDPEYESRTVFVGNLAAGCKKEELMKIFKPYGKIDSVRFRNIVPEDLTKTKKYAFITKQQHPNAKTITAFVRFKDRESALKAAEEVNSMEYKSLHLRVDIAAKPKQAKENNKKSLFLGGLPFEVSDEDLYKHFAACGPIDYVRVIRDNKTGIGKGFGYVAFKTDDCLALGIKLDGSSLNGRKIRVTRCIKKQKIKKESKTNNPRGQIKRKFEKRSNERSKESVVSKPEFKKQKTTTHSDEKNKKPLKTDTKKVDATKKDKKKFNAKKNKKKLAKKKHISTNNKNAVRFKI